MIMLDNTRTTTKRTILHDYTFALSSYIFGHGLKDKYYDLVGKHYLLGSTLYRSGHIKLGPAYRCCGLGHSLASSGIN